MSVILILVGIGEIAIGGLWAFSALSGPLTGASLIVAVPGLAVAANGVLFLAAGSAIDSLARIARATERTAHLLDQQFNPRDEPAVR